MKDKPLFTVFTPTYNRENTLHRVYQSLMQQTFRDFEWLIVDDGSTDDTGKLVAGWQEETATWFPIRYIWQTHQHKKTAHNHGVREARGTLFLSLDSDDCCLPKALERFAFHWLAIPESERSEFSEVTALCVDEEGAIIGDCFPCKAYLDSTYSEIYYRYGVTGEKFGCQRLDVLRQFLFPDEIPGYMAQGVTWSKIARHYKARFINEPLRVYYQDATQQISNEHVRRTAPGHLLWKLFILSDEMHYFRYKPMPFILDAARLTRFYLHCSKKFRTKFWPNQALGKLLVAVMFPVGVTWYWYDMLIKKQRLIKKR